MLLTVTVKREILLELTVGAGAINYSTILQKVLWSRCWLAVSVQTLRPHVRVRPSIMILLLCA
jgi:hypothetical protein